MEVPPVRLLNSANNQAQSLTDRFIHPFCRLVPPFVLPLHLTILAFVCGLIACAHVYNRDSIRALFFWALNRLLDGLDGAVARRRGVTSELGGFLDMLGDFLVYSSIPISCGMAVSPLDNLKQPFTYMAPSNSPWLSIAVLEATFHINNFVLFYGAAVMEKRKRGGKVPSRESTEVAARPALVESLESGVIFTLMLAWPRRIEALSWAMALLVAVGTLQRAQWLLRTFWSDESNGN